jgi:hypothetical protein
MSERDDLKAGIERCKRRVLHLEKWVGKLLEAIDNSEMSNQQEALEKLRRAMERI